MQTRKNDAEQIALAARVIFEITVKVKGREVYATSTTGRAIGQRRAQLEMARIVCAQHPGSRVSFRRIPQDSF